MRIYTYGALDPTEGAGEVDRLCKLSIDYQHKLIEIERKRRVAYRALEREVVGPDCCAELDAAEFI